MEPDGSLRACENLSLSLTPAAADGPSETLE
jgi:hypothetical protein